MPSPLTGAGGRAGCRRRRRCLRARIPASASASAAGFGRRGGCAAARRQRPSWRRVAWPRRRCPAPSPARQALRLRGAAADSVLASGCRAGADPSRPPVCGGLLGAGSLGAGGDAQPLTGAAGALASAAGRRCRGPGGFSFRCRLLGAGPLGAAGDAQSGDGLGGRLRCGCRRLRPRSVASAGSVRSAAGAASALGAALAARSAACFAAVPFSGSVACVAVERPEQQLGHVEHLDASRGRLLPGGR